MKNSLETSEHKYCVTWVQHSLAAFLHTCVCVRACVCSVFYSNVCVEVASVDTVQCDVHYISLLPVKMFGVLTSV